MALSDAKAPKEWGVSEEKSSFSALGSTGRPRRARCCCTREATSCRQASSVADGWSGTREDASAGGVGPGSLPAYTS